jgi:hypothetical protein
MRTRILPTLLLLACSGCGPSSSVREDAAALLPQYQRTSDEMAMMTLVLISMGDQRAMAGGFGSLFLDGLVLGKRLAKDGGTPQDLWKFKEAFVALKAETARLKPAYEEYSRKFLFVNSVQGRLKHLSCGGDVSQAPKGPGSICRTCREFRPEVKILSQQN